MDIVVTADKGGVGKSLMAAHLAGQLDQSAAKPGRIVAFEHRHQFPAHAISQHRR